MAILVFTVVTARSSSCHLCKRNCLRPSMLRANRSYLSIAAAAPLPCHGRTGAWRAIVQAWYPGEQGGRAVGEVLFGNVNPTGRLPVTFYRSTTDLPDFEDYSMANRTYRYFKGKPLFAFGYGLSYTEFSYKNAALDQSMLTAGDTVKVSFDLQNSGERDGDEVAQIYFRHVNSAVPQPKLALCGFTRIHLAKRRNRPFDDGHSRGPVSLLGHGDKAIHRRTRQISTAHRRSF